MGVHLAENDAAFATDVESRLFSLEVDWQPKFNICWDYVVHVISYVCYTNNSFNGETQLERMCEIRQTRLTGEWRIATQMSREGIAQRRTTHARTS